MTEPITRRAFVGTAAGGALATAACAMPGAVPGAIGATAGDGPRATDLVIDASAPLASPARPFAEFREALRRRRAAGFDVVFAPVARHEDFGGTLRNLLALESHLSRLDDEAVLVKSAADLAGLRPRVGVVARLDGLHVGEQIGLLAELRRGGVSVMQLTGYWKNWYADGCLERGNTALTGLGRMVVRAMADAGIILDLAQVGRRSSLEALEITTGPVIVSRANAVAVHNHPQNLTDAQIDAVRQRGGVIGVSAFPPLLSGGRASVNDLVRHLAYMVERAGIDRVAIGLDFDDRPRRRFPDDPLPDPPYAYPPGLNSPADLPAFRQRLASEGYTSRDLDKLFGGNLVRLIDRAGPPPG